MRMELTLSLKIEERTIMSLNAANSVIATGGSVVFRDQSMECLKQDGLLMYLLIVFEEMVHRHNTGNGFS
jgi:shikimate kinase